MLVGCNAIGEWLKKGDEQQSGKKQSDAPAVQTLATPVMSLQDGVITWTADANADRYRVKYVYVETGEQHEAIVVLPELDPTSEELGLRPGVYLFVVRAESDSERYNNSPYVSNERGVTVTIESQVDLTDVTFEVYRVDNDTLLCTWSNVVGADVCHVTVGDLTVDSAERFALIGVDATANQHVVFTVTGKAGYNYAGKQVACDYTALTAKTADVVEYDKKDDALSLNAYNPQRVEWDGETLNQAFTGRLTLGADMLREQKVGTHYLRVTTALGVAPYLVQISDTRPLVFVSDTGAVIEEMDYVLTRDLVVKMSAYQNTVTAVTYDDNAIPEASLTLTASQLTVSVAYLKGVGEGDHVLRLTYRDVQAGTHSVSLTVHAAEPSIPTYDVAGGTDLKINGIPAGTTGVIGASITSSDYTMTASTITFKASYLAKMHAGVYTYWLQGPNGDAFSLQVINSTSKPYDVVLSYDEHATHAYGKFKCDCGDNMHFYQLDGGVRTEIGTFSKDLGVLEKLSAHTFTVYCAKNDTTASYTIAPPGVASTYLDARYTFEGRSPDTYIGSMDEFVDVARYLSYGGNVDYSKGEYGVSELKVFVDGNVIKSDDSNAVLNMLLTESNSRFSSPYGCSMLLSGTFDNAAHTCELTVTVSFNGAIPKAYIDDIEPKTYADTRTLLTENATSRATWIEGSTHTEVVGNVQELADLPLGVRPMFSGTDQATQLARAAYEAALAVCKTYIRDSMTDIQKVQTFYDYLSRFTTYDDYALVWYEVSERLRYLEYNKYVEVYNAAHVTNTWNAFSNDEREDINAATNYRALANLVRRKAAEQGAKAFWTDWSSSLDGFETDTLADIKDYARQQVIVRSYTGTSLDANVNTMCAEDTYAGMIEVLTEMTSSAAFDSYGCLVGHVAVCDGISDSFRVLCLVEGIECVKISGRGKNENHAWNKVRIGDHWYCVDATWSKAAGCVTHRYFMVSDSVLSTNHDERVSDVSRVETLALACEYNYYRDTVVHGVSLYAENAAEFKSSFKTLYGAGETTIEFYLGYLPDESSFKKALSDAISEMHLLGGVSYTYSYADGYALILF